jgi:dihydrolipoamide dehydrogenase
MYNLTVIGGGLGGYGAAIRAAQKGKKVLLIEKDKIGGTCLNLGCIPTKALLYSSFLYEKTKEYKRYGISVENVEYNWNEIIKFKDSIVDKLVKGVEFLLKKNRVTIIKGEAKFIGEKKISVNGENYESDYFLIATGSKSSTPPFLTKNIESNIFFSDKLFSLEKLPESIAIVGAGVIGVEAATIFSRLGKRVYLIEIMNQIIPGADKESVSYIRKSLKKKGVEILTSTLVKEINKEKSNFKIIVEKGKEKSEIISEAILISTGRTGNSESLNLESIKIKTDKKGFVNTAADFKLKDWLYAVGDIRGGKLLAHKALHEGIMAVENMFEDKKFSTEEELIPGVVYTEPEYASVGLTEEQAKERYENIRIGRFPLAANGRALIQGESGGFVKMIFGENKLTGAHIVSPAAGEMITTLEYAIKNKAEYKDMENIIFPHPTVSETIGESLMNAFNEAIHIINR